VSGLGSELSYPAIGSCRGVSLTLPDAAGGVSCGGTSGDKCAVLDKAVVRAASSWVVSRSKRSGKTACGRISDRSDGNSQSPRSAPVSRRPRAFDVVSFELGILPTKERTEKIKQKGAILLHCGYSKASLMRLSGPKPTRPTVRCHPR